MTSIRPLSEGVRSSVRSGILLFDLTRVVEELVFNSLDAGATKVSVFVGVGSCYIKVVDNGVGITREGLVLVGERYATSKFLGLADLDATSGSFGFRGEALASISEISLLEIVTRTYGRANGYRKVLKGCKCLYLGIDDDSKEVGTTVVVRDLFYNQQVRRKYIQASPKKVLQSLKKCMLRLSLIRPSVSFKVVDIESEDELLCTRPSSSPLSLLTSGFGVEVSSSLHELEVCDDAIKLSGYISGPCNSFTLKALQYVYINSQFVCKGPIHKLLSQLAIRFEQQESWNAENGFQNKKRSRSQACPAFILNLSCPRSLYDLTFEPSKTHVQFKDWAPILNFIEKAIKQVWKENITSGKSSNYTTYMAQADQPWKVGDNIMSAEGTSKHGNLDSPDLFSSTLDQLTEDYHLSNTGDIQTPPGYLHRGNVKFKKPQTKGAFVHQTGCSSNLLDGSYAQCMSTVTKKPNCLWMYNSGQSGADNFLDCKFAAVESSNDFAAFDTPSSSRQNKFLQVDTDVTNESYEAALVYDHHEFCSDIEINGDIQKPFLKSCSVQGSVQHEKALFINDEHEFQVSSFRTKKNLGTDYVSDEDLFAHPSSIVLAECNMSRDSGFTSKTFAEENCFPSDSCFSAPHTGCSGSDHQLLNSQWYSIYTDTLSQATARDVNLMAADNVLEGITRHCKRDCYVNLFDEENQCNFCYDMSSCFNEFYCTSSFANSQFDSDGPSDWDEKFLRLVDQPDCDNVHSTKCSDISTNVLDWLCLDLCGENQRSSKSRGKKDHFRHLHFEKSPERSTRAFLSENKAKMDHFRHPDFKKNCKRSRRSHSAPPFCRSKRRFSLVNQSSNVIARSPTGQNAPNYREAVESKLPQLPPGALHQRTEIRCNIKQRPDILAGTEVNEVRQLDFNIQDNAPHEELSPRELEDFIDYRTKWRNYFPQIPTNSNPIDVQSQNTILDISSGFLHLAGNSLVPKTISKNCLGNAKVLYQVDKKFIPIVAGRTLAVIDQHAADERIRLEELRQKVLSGEAKTTTYLVAEQELVLPEIGLQLLQTYSEQIKDWGWICNIHGQDSKSFKRNLDILNRQPTVITLIALPCILGVNLNVADLMEFLQQLADTDGSSTMPPSVIRVLNSKACRGAIMFGDSLLPSECSLLVEELKHTSLCFQCAHGRPTTVPLVNLEALHNEIAKLGLMNDRSNNKWHGLHRHKICIERTAQRLSSAREQC